MRNIVFIFVMFLSLEPAFGQTDTKTTMRVLQECLNLNAHSQQDVIKLYDQVGMIEHTIMNLQQRIKLSDLEIAEVKKSNNGFAVELSCSNDNKCISLVKNDTANTPITHTHFQFSDAALANTFAENLSSLVLLYKTNEPPLKKILYQNEQGKTPILSVKRAPEQAAAAPKTDQTKSNDSDTDDDAEAKKTAQAQTAPKMNAEEREEARIEKKEELQRKANERKEAREEQMTARKEARDEQLAAKKEARDEQTTKREKRKTKKEETASESEEDADEQNSKPKRRTARQSKQDEKDAEEPQADENSPGKSNSRKTKGSGNSLIEDIGDAGDGPEKNKATKDFCVQLLNILQSGKDSQFKSIEGKLTQAETKINDSKVKLKGARKNYLSWFKKERAFIAELKSGNDYESMLKEFESLQTQLDECLGSNWDMEDRSASEEYAKLKTEVKDVEFRHDSDEKMPAVRVIFIEDQDKFTLFMRIQ